MDQAYNFRIIALIEAITVHIITKVKNIFLEEWCTDN